MPPRRVTRGSEVVRAAAFEALEGRTLLAGVGVAGAYFARTNLTAAKFSRTDSAISFNWTSGTPASSLGTDGFSVRWVGRVEPKFSEIYKFIATTSGGVRVWIGGQLVIDNWSAHTQQANGGNMRLTGGKRYDIRLDYWSNGSSPIAKLEWQSARQARQVIPANRLYPGVLDRTVPAMPPHFRAASITPTTVNLAWDRASDPSGVVTYDVYSGSTKVASTSPGALSYSRMNLAPSTGYTFCVVAVDAAGNNSAMAKINTTTAGVGNAAPSAPSGLKISDVDANSVSLSWTAARDSDGTIASYRVYRNGVKLGVAPTGTTFTDTGLQVGVKYSYMVRAVDNDGAFSGFSNTASALTAPGSSNVAPTVPGNFHVSGTAATAISLAWSASSDSDGTVTSYRVYRNGVKLDANITGTSFTDTGLAPGTSYSYSVRAVDNFGAFSDFSSTINASTTQSNGHNAYSTIAASNFDESSGITTNGSDLNNLDDGDFVRYTGVDFGGGAKSVKLNLALNSSNRGGWIELHLDSADGQKIGQVTLQPTATNWNTFATQATNISTASGVHDLYLVFRGRSDMAVLRSIQFSTTHLTAIMALGDSITQQNATSASYRYYLWHKLIDAGHTDIDFVGGQTQAWTSAGTLTDPPNFDFDQNHEGHAGWRADQIADSVSGWAAVNPPDIVLLMAGTNDFIDGQSVSSTLNDIGRVIDNLRGINPNVKVLVAQILPDFQSGSINSAINQFNAQLPGFIQGKSTGASPLIVVDQNSGFSSGDTQEGLHTNSSGDQKLADNWFAALAPLL